MKTKYLLSFLLCAMLSIPTAEAQLLKKIKDKILNKTESEQKIETEQDSTEEGSTTSEPTDEEQNQKTQKIMSMFGGGLEGVPDVYAFSYALTYEITTKKETIPFQYFLEPDATYFANKLEDPKANTVTVYDLKKNIMVNFMDNGTQKMAMKMTMPNMKKVQKKYGNKLFSEDGDEETQITPIEGKTIQGFACLGFKVINKDGEGKIWITNEAPVSLNGVYANFKTLSKKTEHTNVPITEKSLIMEMEYQSKKKKSDFMHMICTELIPQEFKLRKEEYKTGS